VAAILRRDLKLEVETVEGHYGEFTVLVDGEHLIDGGLLGFMGVLPSVREIRSLLEQKMSAAAERPGGA